MKLKRIISGFIVAVLLFGVLNLLQRLVMPKYMSGIVEGALISEYYRENTEHDVIFISDCEVYENFSPVTLWEEYGITGFIRGSAQQLIWQSYYLLEETLKYEKPEVVVFNVLSMKYNEPQKEAYNRMALDGMKMSKSKLNSIKASMMEDEHLADYLFPLLRYHSRWDELNKDDIKYMFKKKQVSHNGYYMRVDVKPVTSIPKRKKLADYSFGENAWHYLDSIVKICKENDINLVFIKAPTLYPHWYDEWEKQIEEYADRHEILYINFLEHLEESGIDFNTDTYDMGLHLNLSGAEKLSKYFGKILKNKYSLKDHRNDNILSNVWQEKIDFYYSEKEKQYKELEEFGYLKSFGAKAP
jgi:hypothetical protein